MGSDDCLRWADARSCTPDGLMCAVVDGVALCVCEDRDWVDWDAEVTDASYLSRLEGVTRIPGGLFVDRSDLRNIDGLECLTRVERVLYIRTNRLLENIDGLSSLVSIGSDLDISRNSVLEDVQGLSSLSLIEGNMHFNGANLLLTSLDGLESLTHVEGNLVISGNQALVNLDGLHSLEHVGGFLRINFNESLPTCEAEALRDHLVAAGWGGEAHIYDNDDSGTCD